MLSGLGLAVCAWARPGSSEAPVMADAAAMNSRRSMDIAFSPRLFGGNAALDYSPGCVLRL